MSDPNSPEELDARPAAVLGWAVYLASSWTWCVGMFLPVLLVRDYGVRGWTAFAIPNVLGAAAMGWTIGSAARMRDLAARHRSASLWFSIVTISFQAYFAVWFVAQLAGNSALIALAAVVVVALVISARKNGLWLVGLAGLAVSIAILLKLRTLHALLPVSRDGLMPGRDLPFVAAAMAFGFLLNPYLDLTFQRARSRTTAAAARAAFTLGFGLFFFIMIAMTLAYSPWLTGMGKVLLRSIALLLAAHMLAHLGITIAFHLRELAARRADISRLHGAGGLALLLAAIALASAARRPLMYHGMALGEIGYWLFIGFYGILFPTYLWLFMVPPALPWTPATRLVMWTAMLMALPLFWMGFIEGQMPCVATALLILLGCKFLARRAAALTPPRSAR